jgi:toxin secretion/phage lysis holin
MENAVQIKNGVLAGLAIFGSFLANALGGWDGALKVLVIMMVADYVTGLLVAALWHKSPKSDSGALDSRAGFKGIVRKCMILLLVWVAAAMDRYLGINFARAAVILFFIGNEGLSLLENMGLMGVPYPQKFKNALEALKKQGDEGSTGNA